MSNLKHRPKHIWRNRKSNTNKTRNTPAVGKVVNIYDTPHSLALTPTERESIGVPMLYVVVSAVVGTTLIIMTLSMATIRRYFTIWTKFTFGRLRTKFRDYHHPSSVFCREHKILQIIIVMFLLCVIITRRTTKTTPNPCLEMLLPICVSKCLIASRDCGRIEEERSENCQINRSI